MFTTIYSTAEPEPPTLVAPTLLADGVSTNLTLSHAGADRGVYSAGASATTITVQPLLVAGIPLGAIVPLLQLGGGRLTVAASGVTINKPSDRQLYLRGAGSSAVLHHWPAVNTWQLMGDLSAT